MTDAPYQSSSGSQPRIVIVGAGFAGLEVAKTLGKAGIAATVIDRRNHHLFQPLLYQVATADISATDIAEPIRKILKRQKSIQVIFGEVTSIDPQRKLVHLSEGSDFPYDILVLAPGSRASYFGHDEWATVAPGLKTLEDARTIRSRLLWAFEQAERSTDPEEQRRLMTFIVIGGGPTGVELAGSIAELALHTLAQEFRNIEPKKTRIMLVEAGPRLLAGFSPKVSDYAKRALERLGVEVSLGKAVEKIMADHVVIAGESIPAGLTVWAAGVSASPLTANLGVERDRMGRVEVAPTLQVIGCPDVYALGDIARFTDDKGNLLPGLAQVAKQQGQHFGEALVKKLQTGTELPPFVYRSRGNTAIIGRHAGVFEAGETTLKGWFAWVAWAFIHVYLLVGFQHRVQVSLQWLWRYLTYDRGARLISSEQLPQLPHGRADRADLSRPE